MGALVQNVEQYHFMEGSLLTIRLDATRMCGCVEDATSAVDVLHDLMGKCFIGDCMPNHGRLLLGDLRRGGVRPYTVELVVDDGSGRRTVGSNDRLGGVSLRNLRMLAIRCLVMKGPDMLAATTVLVHELESGYLDSRLEVRDVIAA